MLIFGSRKSSPVVIRLCIGRCEAELKNAEEAFESSDEEIEDPFDAFLCLPIRLFPAAGGFRFGLLVDRASIEGDEIDWLAASEDQGSFRSCAEAMSAEETLDEVELPRGVEIDREGCLPSQWSARRCCVFNEVEGPV